MIEIFDKYVDWNTTEGKIIEALLMWFNDEELKRFIQIYEL